MTTAYQDHDQRFKALLREFFPDFLRLFFPEWARRFDLTSVGWVDGELLPDPPDGPRHRLDLVAELRATEPTDPAHPEPEHWLALVHVEVESPDRTTAVTPRLPAYYLHLSERYGRPVLPVVLYQNVALNGIGVEAVVRRFWLEVLRVQYLYVGLPGLDAEQYVRGDNWLGVGLSSLMRMPAERAGELGIEALRRILAADGLTEQQQYLLSECVEAYLPVDDAELNRITGIVEAETPERSRPMQRNKTRYDRAWEKGVNEGQREAYLRMAEDLLTAKFGGLTAAQLAALRRMPNAELTTLGPKLLTAAAPADLGLGSE